MKLFIVFPMASFNFAIMYWCKMASKLIDEFQIQLIFFKQCKLVCLIIH